METKNILDEMIKNNEEVKYFIVKCIKDLENDEIADKFFEGKLFKAAVTKDLICCGLYSFMPMRPDVFMEHFKIEKEIIIKDPNKESIDDINFLYDSFKQIKEKQVKRYKELLMKGYKDGE